MLPHSKSLCNHLIIHWSCLVIDTFFQRAVTESDWWLEVFPHSKSLCNHLIIHWSCLVIDTFFQRAIMTIFKLYHIKPISGRRIISVLDWSRNFILAKLISDIFRSINRTHAHRNGIWTTHCQHYNFYIALHLAAFTWTSWRWKITKLKIKCMLTPNMLRKKWRKK